MKNYGTTLIRGKTILRIYKGTCVYNLQQITFLDINRPSSYLLSGVWHLFETKVPKANGKASYSLEILNLIQWGSENLPLEILKHLKCGLFESLISNGWGLAMAIECVNDVAHSLKDGPLSIYKT